MRREEPLLSRGWVLQERILATRTLQFTSYNMRLECSKQVFTEPQFVDEYGTAKETSLERIGQGLESIKNAAPTTGTQQILVPAVIGRSYGWRVWARMIEDYTSRNLSFASDKFPALGGVISALQELTGDTCFAGIWKSWFLQGLLWRLQDPNWDEYVFFPKEPQRAVPWRAPTWSFASVEGVVLYLLLEENFDQALCAELLSCEVTPKGKNPLGELTDGFAKIRGPIAAVSAVSSDLSLNGRECMVSMTNGRLAEASIYFDIDVYDSCQVLIITPHMGVAIIPTEVAEGTYTRVGVVSVYRVFDAGSDTRSRGKRAHENRDRSISASHYPSPEIITLL
ncbi:hypothetical protein J4E80_006297 [Alternaria sp. BMP 0032]|nr:hypothetical protein J4E80_006297 [Alternaria sp. BMP 0032]